MAQGFDQVGEYFRSLSRKQVCWVVCGLVLVALMLTYFKVVRPHVNFTYRAPHIYIMNEGKLDGLINRVDGFLFWKDQIAYIGNMPEVQQTVHKGTTPEVLQIGEMPPVDVLGERSERYYLKLVVRYQIPGIPVFRYTSLLYLEYDQARHCWEQAETIPGRYRSFGRVGTGDVNVIRLAFD